MTCIVGYENDDGAWVGGDSCASNNYTQHTHEAGKVFEVGPLLMGCSGSIRVSQILRYHLTVPLVDPNKNDHEWLVTDVVEAIRSLLDEKGAHQTKDGVTELQEGAILIAYRGRIYTIKSDYLVLREADYYSAIGSGEEVALGALWGMSYAVGVHPSDMVEMAIQAAEHHAMGVRGPITVRHQPRPKGDDNGNPDQ